MNGDVGQTVTFTGGSSPEYIYCFDSVQGIFRSDNFGEKGSWTLIFPTEEAKDTGSGYLAVNPSVRNQLCATTGSGLYVLNDIESNAAPNGTIPATKVGTITSAGGVAFYNGSVYCVWTSSKTHPDAQLVGTPATSPSWYRQQVIPWTDVGGPAFGSRCSRPGTLAINLNGLAITNSLSENAGVYTQLA